MSKEEPPKTEPKVLAQRVYKGKNRRIAMAVWDDGAVSLRFKKLEGRKVVVNSIVLSAEAARTVALGLGELLTEHCRRTLKKGQRA